MLYEQTMPKTEGVSLRKLKNKMARLRERAAITRSDDAIKRLHYIEEAIRKKERWSKKS